LAELALEFPSVSVLLTDGMATESTSDVSTSLVTSEKVLDAVSATVDSAFEVLVALFDEATTESDMTASSSSVVSGSDVDFAAPESAMPPTLADAEVAKSASA
jgi:hypothetical protein